MGIGTLVHSIEEKSGLIYAGSSISMVRRRIRSMYVGGLIKPLQVSPMYFSLVGSVSGIGM